jgi:hypothetical protein
VQRPRLMLIAFGETLLGSKIFNMRLFIIVTFLLLSSLIKAQNDIPISAKDSVIKKYLLGLHKHQFDSVTIGDFLRKDSIKNYSKLYFDYETNPFFLKKVVLDYNGYVKIKIYLWNNKIIKLTDPTTWTIENIKKCKINETEIEDYSYQISYTNPENKEQIAVTVEIVGKGNLAYSRYPDTCNFFSRLAVINNDSVPVSFSMMNCGWKQNWISNNKDIWIEGNGCDVNFPITITLKPREFLSFYCILRPRNKDVLNKKFRLGFELLDYKEAERVYDYKSDNERLKKVYWSNEIQLKDCQDEYKLNGTAYFNDEWY